MQHHAHVPLAITFSCRDRARIGHRASDEFVQPTPPVRDALHEAGALRTGHRCSVIRPCRIYDDASHPAPRGHERHGQRGRHVAVLARPESDAQFTLCQRHALDARKQLLTQGGRTALAVAVRVR